MEKLPSEVVDLIIGQLFHHRRKGDLRRARLVCRTWNQHAIRHLFGTITLRNTFDTIENDFQSWNNLMDLQIVKDNIQHVIIEICDHEIGRSHPRWDLWVEQGQWPAFTSAVDRIIGLDHLHTIELCFSQSEEVDERGFNEEELRRARRAALEAIHKSVKQRQERRLHGGIDKISPIRKLILEWLREDDSFELLVNGYFKNIQHLYLQFSVMPETWQVSEVPENSDRINFNYNLEHPLLTSVMDQLVDLNIASLGGWGLLPSRFDGKSLMFPNLKRLKLCDFEIGHYDQLEWVLNQKTLTCLRLHDCRIVTHFHFEGSIAGRLVIGTGGWQRFDDGSGFINYPDNGIKFYTFDLRWKTVFENIINGLPNLTDFSTSWVRDLNASMYHAPPTEAMMTRYTGLHEIEPDCTFVRLIGDESQHDRNNPESSWHLSASAYETDAQALNALLQATFERRRR